MLITNIGELLTMVPRGDDPLGRIAGAAVAIDAGQVVYAGPASGAPQGAHEIIDAEGALVSPGLIDPHTHPIFAGSRAPEFDLRARGKSYAEIQSAGGGILSTVHATCAASDAELIASTLARLDRLMRHGVTACETKTGYALDGPGELRLLRLLCEVQQRHAVDLSITLLAHVPPPEENRSRFVASFAHNTIPTAARAGAEALDVYCDQGAFTREETRTLLEAGRAVGLRLRVHAEQFTHTGVADLAAELGATSVEHLEQLSESSIAGLAAAGTVCTLLPGAALTLRLPWPDARRLIDGGCTVALGTDLNPGSSYTESLPLMMSLACMQMGMSCAEAWRGVTVAAAHAIGRRDAGWVGRGARGDLVLWDATDHREVIQHYGVPLVRRVVISGSEQRLGARPE